MEGAVTPANALPWAGQTPRIPATEGHCGSRSGARGTACRAWRIITGREGHPPPLSKEGAGGEERATQRELWKELTLIERLLCARCCPVRELTALSLALGHREVK